MAVSFSESANVCVLSSSDIVSREDDEEGFGRVLHGLLLCASDPLAARLDTNQKFLTSVHNTPTVCVKKSSSQFCSVPEASGVDVSI